MQFAFRVFQAILTLIICGAGAAQAYVGQFLATFQDFPPRQKPASFSIDQVMEKLQHAGGSK